MTLEFNHLTEAARRIGHLTVRTPLLEHPELNDLAGARVLLKLENLQRTGSFKFRGACNRLLQLSSRERQSGVVAWSSGNHAQGIAAAARLLGIQASIVMPKTAASVKCRNTLALGAKIHFYDPETEDREVMGRSLAEALGAVLVPSYDDYAVMAGQGTVGTELFAQSSDSGLQLDQLLVPCGGGGLLAGVATAAAAMSPATRVFSVEPAGLDDHARSFVSGRRESNLSGAASICDALLAPSPGRLTFPINRKLVAGGLCVSEDEVRRAMHFAWSRMKLLLEPGGAVALAAAMHQLPKNSAARQVGVLLSGGNTDMDSFFALTETS